MIDINNNIFYARKDPFKTKKLNLDHYPLRFRQIKPYNKEAYKDNTIFYRGVLLKIKKNEDMDPKDILDFFIERKETHRVLDV